MSYTNIKTLSSKLTNFIESNFEIKFLKNSFSYKTQSSIEKKLKYLYISTRNKGLPAYEQIKLRKSQALHERLDLMEKKNRR